MRSDRPRRPAAPLPGLDGSAAGPTVVRCGMCGRVLTTPSARRRGIGPECWHKVHGGPGVRAPGRFVVEQEPLPET